MLQVQTPTTTSNFNPRSPHGERHALWMQSRLGLYDFNPRSPHGERQLVRVINGLDFPFQPTLPARGATKVNCVSFVVLPISTHAPRTGSDP